MTYEEYVDASTRAYIDNAEWRLGQAYFNTLAEVRPDLSEAVNGGPLDPFYSRDPQRFGDFLVFVAGNW